MKILQALPSSAGLQGQKNKKKTKLKKKKTMDGHYLYLAILYTMYRDLFYPYSDFYFFSQTPVDSVAQLIMQETVKISRK